MLGSAACQWQTALCHCCSITHCLPESLKGTHYSICSGVALELYCSFFMPVSCWEKTKQAWRRCTEGWAAAGSCMAVRAEPAEQGMGCSSCRAGGRNGIAAGCVCSRKLGLMWLPVPVLGTENGSFVSSGRVGGCSRSCPKTVTMRV